MQTQHIGEIMPGFRLPLLDGGGERSLQDLLRDRSGALFVFWSGSCAHCVRYDAFFNGFLDRYPGLGFAAIASMLQRLNSDRILRSWDHVVIVLGGVAVVHPWSRVGPLVLTVLGLLFIFRSDRRRASLGQLCLGLAWIGLWGPLVFRLIQPWFLPMETALGYLPLSIFGSYSLVGNAIFSDTGHGVVVYPGCSVFANTIRTTFIWLALVKVQGTEFRPWHFRVLALSLVIVFFLNTSRLGLMAYSYNGYFFWHESYGANIMSWTMLATVMGLFYFGLRREGSS